VPISHARCRQKGLVGQSAVMGPVAPLTARRMSSGPTPGTANSTDPSGPVASTILNRFRLMLRSPGPPGRLISTTRSRSGIGTTSLRCRQYRRHVIPVESIVKVPCVKDRGTPAALPLKKQLTSRDSPPSKAARSLWRCESPVARGSLTVSTGWRRTSKKVRVPPALRGLLTLSRCHGSPSGCSTPPNGGTPALRNLGQGNDSSSHPRGHTSSKSCFASQRNGGSSRNEHHQLDVAKVPMQRRSEGSASCH
jgi:hypothetical protein